MTDAGAIPVSHACFTLAALGWGFLVQPAVLNEINLPLWMLSFGAFGSLFPVENARNNV